MSARTILKHLHQQGRMTDYQFDVINRNLKERPQGEWIGSDGEYQCNKCYEKRWYRSNYCPQCGAMMKEAENNES